jgi:pimeloyl-ACP methyl ester carboxylesterase
MKLRVILVHGTWSRLRSDRVDWVGDKSAISAKLKESFGQDITVEAFNWSGSNQHDSRICAAYELMRQIDERWSPDQKVVLIGHSHGGMVSCYAAALPGAERISCVITLSTPFLVFKSKPMSIPFVPDAFQRKAMGALVKMSRWGFAFWKVFVLFTVVILVCVGLVKFGDWLGDSPLRYAPYTIAGLLAWFSLGHVLVVEQDKHKRGIGWGVPEFGDEISAMRKRYDLTRVRAAVYGLRTRFDEAYSGLFLAKALNKALLLAILALPSLLIMHFYMLPSIHALFNIGMADGLMEKSVFVGFSALLFVFISTVLYAVPAYIFISYFLRGFAYGQDFVRDWKRSSWSIVTSLKGIAPAFTPVTIPVPALGLVNLLSLKHSRLVSDPIAVSTIIDIITKHFAHEQRSTAPDTTSKEIEVSKT